MMTTSWRLVPLATSILVSVLVAVPRADQTSSGASKASALRVGVLCVFSQKSAFPFAAGNDRCFKEIMTTTAGGVRGQTLVPMSTDVCLLRTTDGPRLTFIYSAVPKPACGGRAGYGDPASKDQYEPGLASLGPREKAFFLKHIGSGTDSTAK
jgi:hypothetical protein